MTAEQAAYWPEDFPIRVRSAARRYHALAAPRSSWKATRFAEGPLAENLMRLWPGLEAWPLPDEALEKEVLARFIPPPHRMELLDMPGAGRVVDDSKSTCLAATAAALKVEGKGVHLIAGGRGKGEDPAELRPLLSELGVSVYLIGESAGTLADSWEGHAAYCERCGTLEHAVARAWARRDRSQPLLFSPGCASFDQFTGFAHRGEHFQQLVSGQARKNPLNGIHPE